jgi:2-polyprenyl-3-methyl-5-hydroxy-6-metoxy-1,4-benzoquinol methylase
LPRGATILDVGCGHGVPISQTLIDEGFIVYGLDASPTLIDTFRARFPRAPTRCEAIEDSDFFGRVFDAVVAWGVIFLLEPAAQEALIRKAARSLGPKGKLLFTSPSQRCEWEDILTQRTSCSLGADAYRRLLANEGMRVVDEHDDEGENHYYMSEKL